MKTTNYKQEQQPRLVGAQDLRTEAERRLIVETASTPLKNSGLGSERLLHELQVYHVELEIQNEVLQKSRLEIEESRDMYAVLFELLPSAYLGLDSDLRITRVNLAAIDLLQESVDSLQGKPFTYWLGADSADAFYLHCQKVRQLREKQTCELELSLVDGSTHTVQVATVALDVSETAEQSYLISIADITAREEARTALSREHAQLEARVAERTKDLAAANLELQRYSAELKKLSRVVEQSRSLIIMTDARGIIEYVNPRFTELSSVGTEEVIGHRPSFDILGFTDEWKFDQVWKTIQSGTEWRGIIENFQTNGERACLELRVSWIADDAGAITHYLIVGEDVTERKVGEERQHLLLEELNHRVKNTLSVVLSIAKQTLRTTRDMTTFRDAFEGRIMALAQLHRLLTKNNWDAVALEDLVNSATKPYTDSAGPKVVIEGPMIKLDLTDAQSFHFVFHELATNAAKYGAFAVSGGTVKVSWKLKKLADKSTSISLGWVEKGGPKVTSPTRQGFGIELIERTIVIGMGGTVEVLYPPSGLCWNSEVIIHNKGERAGIC